MTQKNIERSVVQSALKAEAFSIQRKETPTFRSSQPPLDIDAARSLAVAGGKPNPPTNASPPKPCI
jgi:hypothetical protein